MMNDNGTVNSVDTSEESLKRKELRECSLLINIENYMTYVKVFAGLLGV